MKKEFEKSIKHWLKRKISITLATIVGVLIAGVESFADINIVYDETTQELIITKDGEEITNGRYGIISGNNTDGWTWTNDGNILEQVKIGKISGGKFDIVNGGVINVLGNGIYFSSPITRLTNSGTITGDNNGIYLANSSITSLINTGVISGRGNGISLESYSPITNLINSGIISGESSGKGIFLGLYSQISSLINTGIISGNGSGTDSGNGVFLNSNILALTNTGIISGNGSGTDSGNGIYAGNDCRIETLNNYGIIAGNNQAIDKGNLSIGNEKNYGLLIDGAGTENQKITAGAGGEVDGKYIINGVNEAGENAIATNIKSSELKDNISSKYYDSSFGSYNNIIVNVVGDESTAFIVDGIIEDGKHIMGITLEDSIINGYKTAVQLQGKNSLTAYGTTINGDILGDDSNNELNFFDTAGDKTKYNIVNGNINLGGGVDTVRINQTILNGKITADNDEITTNKSNINGDLTLTNSTINLTSSNLNGNIIADGGKINIFGNNNLFNVGATTINGNITLTNGEIYIKDGSIINGDIILNGESTTVLLDKNQTFNGQITVDESVKNKTLGVNYSINSDDDMISLKNQTDKFNDFNVKLSDSGNNNVVLSDLNISSITGGSGDDIFKSSIAGLAGKEVNGGAGTDTLNLLDNITEETQIDFSEVTNVENLKLADGGNTLDVSNSTFKNILGGNGNDIFNNVSSEILFTIDGGAGDDTINMAERIALDNTKVDTIFKSIENLNLVGNNNVLLNNLDNISKINFGLGDNTLTLGAKESGTEFDFTQENIITGNVKIDLNGNVAVVNSTSDGNTVTINNNFINGNGILDNGTIRLNLSQNTDFSKGIETSLNLNSNGVLGNNTTVETYAFLKVEGDTITVKSWKELSGDENITDTDNLIYDSTIKDFNEDGVYGALTKWESESIVKWIKDKNGEVLGDYIFDNNGKEYNTIVSNGILTVDTNIGGALNGFAIDDLSSKGFVIKNNSTEGDGKVSFTGETVVEGNIINESSNETNIVFEGKTSVGNIDSSKSTANTVIDINNKFSSGNIIFNDNEKNELKITDSSNIENIGAISGNVDIKIESIGENSDGFNKILVGANAGLNGDSNSIIVTDDQVNANIKEDYKGTLTFSGNNNNIILGSIIGNLVMGNENDTINLDTSKFKNDIVVNVDGGNGSDDIFNVGYPVLTLEEDINQKLDGKTLSGNIKSFENININESINFASDLEITGTEKIIIEAGKQLGLNVDYTKTEDGKVIGHALYNKGIEVDNNNGNILVGASTANEDATISMGKDNVSTITNKDNIFVSDSINHNISYDKDNNEINVIVKDDLELGKDESVKYSHLNDIYKSIVDAGKIGLMAPSSTLTDKTEAEAIQAQLEFYGKIYTSTPYAYSNDISRETANMVNNSIMDSRFKADEGNWLHYGAIAGQGYDDDNSYYGRGYYNSVDLGTTDVNVESNIYGAYYMGEYGKTDKLALGYVVAGNKSNTDSGESQLKSSGYYLGGYAKYDINSFRIIAGAGFQHNYYDADRKVSNDYQAMSTSKKYTDDTFTAYAGARYIHNLFDSLTVEPFAKLNLTYVMQGGIKEADKGDLSISVDEKDFTSVDSEIGIDLIKSTIVKDGKVNLIVGVSADIMLDGYEKENLTAKINGSSTSFDIVSEKEENFRGKVKLGVEYEKINGIFYNAKGSYIKTEDNNDYKFEIGIGYKF